MDVASQKTNEEFIVLIIGAFSSGKTGMINALIGENLLPTGFLPETAIFCELHYGKQKRITVYPRGGDEPFDLREVTTEEIRKYVSLSTEDAINVMEQNDEGIESDARINAKFEKMITYWPLEILKDGVVLVDSPGINDPYSNDYIVNDYLPKADAMIKDAERFNVAADQDKDEIKRRIDESEQRLQMARNKSVQAVKNFRNTLEGRLLEVEKMIREFLTQKLPTLIDLEDFQPETTLPDGLSKLNPLAGRRKAKALQDECQKEILRRMNLEYRKWATHTLNNCLQRAANFPSKAFDVSKLPFPEYVFELIPMMHLSIIADIDVNRNDKIKFLVVKYAKEFFYDPAFKNEVDNIVGDIMADIRMYVEDSCADAEKVFNSEVTHAEQIVRQTLEESNADLATKTALISQRNAAVDKLYDIKVAAMQIGRD